MQFATKNIKTLMFMFTFDCKSCVNHLVSDDRNDRYFISTTSKSHRGSFQSSVSYNQRIFKIAYVLIIFIRKKKQKCLPVRKVYIIILQVLFSRNYNRNRVGYAQKK